MVAAAYALPFLSHSFRNRVRNKHAWRRTPTRAWSDFHTSWDSSSSCGSGKFRCKCEMVFFCGMGWFNDILCVARRNAPSRHSRSNQTISFLHSSGYSDRDNGWHALHRPIRRVIGWYLCDCDSFDIRIRVFVRSHGQNRIFQIRSFDVLKLRLECWRVNVAGAHSVRLRLRGGPRHREERRCKNTRRVSGCRLHRCLLHGLKERLCKGHCKRFVAVKKKEATHHSNDRPKIR